MNRFGSKMGGIFVLFATLGGAGIAFIVQYIIAKRLAPNEFGLLMSALASATFVAIVATFGIPQLWLKLFAKDVKIYICHQSYRVVTLSSFVFALIFCLWMLVASYSEIISGGWVLAWCPIVVSAALLDLASSKLQIQGRYFTFAALTICQNSLRLIVIVILLATIPDAFSAKWLMIGFSIVGFLMIVLSIVLLREWMPAVPFNSMQYINGIVAGMKLLPQSILFAVAAILGHIFIQIDIVLLPILANGYEAGQFAVAFIFLNAAYLFPLAIFNRYLVPLMHKWRASDILRMKNVYYTTLFGSAIAGFILILVVFCFAHIVLDILFAGRYTSSVMILKIAVIGVPFYFMAASAGAVLNTGELIKKKITGQLFAFIVKLASDILLIPLVGALGAAISIVVGNIALFAIYSNLLRRANIFISRT